MEFEVFNRQSAGKMVTPMITIQRRGSFSFNVALFEALDSPVAVELLFNREKGIIALRKSAGSPHEYPVRKQRNSESFLVAGQAFCQHYEIDTRIARRYQARQFGENTWGFSLDDDHVDITRSARMP